MAEIKERCIIKGDAAYPSALMQIRNAPKKLYVRGELPSEHLPAVAIIGARGCSCYGREMAAWFAKELALAGVQIISGMARGVDGTAQMAALQAGGKSFGVLGCGTDVCYPKENYRLYEQLLEKGGVLSEHPLGTPPIAGHFPGRNRIISALSDCVLVIEAKEKSGSLITVDFALEQGKDVYALPGRLTDALSGGCNRLLCQGAGLAAKPDFILEMLEGKGKYPKWTGCLKKKREEDISEKKENGSDCLEKFSPEEQLVLERMGNRAVGLQELYEEIRLTGQGKEMGLQKVTDILMELTVRKIILPERGNKYRRKNEIRISTI